MPSATFSSETGGIEGLVYSDDEELPLVDIAVGLQGHEDIMGRTNEGGFFALSNVPPGPQTLLFGGLEYQSASLPVTIEAGAVLPVEVRLKRLERPAFLAPGHDQPSPKKGFIGCAVGGMGIYGGTLAMGRDLCSLANGGATNLIEFPKRVGDNLTGMVVSIRWDRASIATGASNMKVSLPVYPDAWEKGFRACAKCFVMRPAVVQGSSGMVVVLDTRDPYVPIWNNKENFLRIAVELTNGNLTETQTWGGVAFQQHFEVAIYQMYNGDVPKLELWE